MDTLNSTLGDRIIFHGDLPVAWTALDHEPPSSKLFELNENNARLLRLFTILDEHAAEQIEGNQEVQQAFSRLDSKLSLVLELVGEVLSRQLDLPSPSHLALSEQGIQWIETQPSKIPEHAQLAYVELYLKPEFPRPLTFLAQMGVDHQHTENGVRFVAKFQGINEDVHDGLAKLIFRQHRRMIASQRSS